METEKLETEDKAEDVFEDNEEIAAEANLEVAQLQGLVAELREGLHAALTELCMLRQRDHGLEEKLQAHQTDVDDKIMSLKNSLNTFKEELSVAMFHINDVTDRQREVFKHTCLHPSENGKEIVGVPKRKGSKADVLKASGDEHICVPSHSDLSILQHYFSSLPQSGSPQRSTTSTQTSHSEREALEQQQRDSPAKPPLWGERKLSRDEMETPSSLTETNKRQRAALELLESERVYVSHLSLLLKANISFNGSEALTSQDKRPFPSSLRFLIQQHLELLHTLQERVLRCQWQGIMGDIFMRLTSKESDFLDLYVSYLKELPDCLSVINMLVSSTTKPSTFLESDIMGDGSKPSLHSLLLQPVQRIPEYMLQLQGLLRHTEAEHPDYYLLLVSVQQFRSFSTQYHHLLQHNQELLLHNRKEANRSTMKQLLNMVENGIQANNLGSVYACSSATLEHANQVKQSKQRLLEQIQSHRFRDWDRTQDPEPHCYEAEWPAHLPFFNPDVDSRNPRPAGLGSIPESELSERSVSCQQHHLPSRQAEFRQPQPGSALADALEEFLLPPDPPGMESLYEDNRSSLPDVSVFDRCSSASSDSSIDIAFVKCPKAPLTPQHAMATNVSTSRDVFVGRQGNGYSKMSNRGCVSPDEAVMMRRNLHRPLQASQRKSKSLNGLQMDNAASDCGPMSDRLGGLGSHAKLERQGSKGSRGCSTPSRKLHSPLGNRMDMDKQGDDLHAMLSMPHQDLGIQSWGDETKWRVATEENNHSAFSERSRKQDKGGFRSSFKKLFKKKNGEEKKEKAGEKVQENQSCGEPEKTAKTVNVEINRGTAV